MALDGDAMGSAVWSAVQAVTPQSGTPITSAQGEAIWKAACGVIVAQIKAAQVQVPAAGLTAPNGPVSGQATGTIV